MVRDSKPICGAWQRSAPLGHQGLICTRPPGHDGPTHTAYDAGGNALSSWWTDEHEPREETNDDSVATTDDRASQP